MEHYTRWFPTAHQKPCCPQQQGDLMGASCLYCDHWMKLKWGAWTVSQITDSGMSNTAIYQLSLAMYQTLSPWAAVLGTNGRQSLVWCVPWKGSHWSKTKTLIIVFRSYYVVQYQCVTVQIILVTESNYHLPEQHGTSFFTWCLIIITYQDETFYILLTTIPYSPCAHIISVYRMEDIAYWKSSTQGITMAQVVEDVFVTLLWVKEK